MKSWIKMAGLAVLAAGLAGNAMAGWVMQSMYQQHLMEYERTLEREAEARLAAASGGGGTPGPLDIPYLPSGAWDSGSGYSMGYYPCTPDYDIPCMPNCAVW